MIGGTTAEGSPRISRPIRELCEEHGYPSEIEQLLQRIVDLVSVLEPRSLLLHGSAARGELTWWREEDGKLWIGSDIEMYLVLDRPAASAEREALESALLALQQEADRGGPNLFHIDVGYSSIAKLRAHPQTFRCWDTRVTGRTLLGEDVRAELPDLAVADIDFRQLNEVPIHRLWEMVFRVPRSMLLGGATPEDVDLFRLVCARQALDLTTWILPHLDALVPTFRKRVAAWEAKVGDSSLNRYLPEESVDFLRECLKGKLRLEFSRPAAALHAEVAEHFRAALRFLLELYEAAGDEEIAAAILARGPEFWAVERPKRRLYEAYLLMRDGQLRRPVAAARWWLRQKKAYQLAVLVTLNGALQEILAGADASRKLDIADRYLGRLWYGYRPAEEDPRRRFLEARRGYVEYLARTSRWFAPRSEYLYSVLNEAPPS